MTLQIICWCLLIRFSNLVHFLGFGCFSLGYTSMKKSMVTYGKIHVCFPTECKETPKNYGVTKSLLEGKKRGGQREHKQRAKKGKGAPEEVGRG